MEYNKDTYTICRYIFNLMAGDDWFSYANYSRYDAYEEQDYDKKMFEDMQEKNGVFFKKSDAFEYDFSNIDLIYLYVPIRDHKIMRKLWEKILREMKIGSCILEVGDVYGLSSAIEDNFRTRKITITEGPRFLPAFRKVSAKTSEYSRD